MNPPAHPALRHFLRLAAVLLAAALPTGRAQEPALQIKDHDVWVMVGDSITAQRQHSNYIEAYYRTRFPKLRLHFRNSGIGGNRTANVLSRFDYDVAAWKPTIVSVELGMNDVNGPEETYVKGLKDIIARIRAIPAQPILISSSPVDDGSIMGDWKSPRCEKIHAFTDAMKKLAAEEKIVCIDQYHPLIDVWGQNRRKGAELAAKNQEAAATPAPPVPPPGTAAPAAATPPPRPPAKPPLPPSLIPLGGDPVHPGPVGQYTMAAVILAGLKADAEVSSATIQADGKVTEAKRCQITGASANGGKLTFTRLDEAGPWPILPAAKPALSLLPEMLKLSQYQLRITGLADGPYRVTINGKPAGVVTAKELSAGWNLTAVLDGALGERSKSILDLVGKLQGTANNEWRAASKANDADKLAAAQKAIENHEEGIQAAVQPVPLRFEIEK